MKAQQSFKGKFALITGGSSGIGFELAKQLLQAGASVALFARSPEKLEAAKAALTPLVKSTNQRIHTTAVDVTQVDALRDAIETMVNTFGIPNFLFNCAGVALPGYVEELDLDVFKWTMDIDYHGTVNATKLLLRTFSPAVAVISSTFLLWQVYSESMVTARIPLLSLLSADSAMSSARN